MLAQKPHLAPAWFLCFPVELYSPDSAENRIRAKDLICIGCVCSNKAQSIIA